MSARSPFDLLGFSDFGQLFQRYHRQKNAGSEPAQASDERRRDIDATWRAVEACGRRYGIEEKELAVLK